MNYIAKWGPMGFVVSPTKIIPFKEFSTTVAIKTDNANDINGSPPTNVRGRELQTMTFSATYLRAVGVDPRARYEEWNALIGQIYPLYIGGKRFGPAKMMLTSVAISELMLSNNGDFLSVTVDITLTEEAQASAGAMTATASAADKQRLSPHKMEVEYR